MGTGGSRSAAAQRLNLRPLGFDTLSGECLHFLALVTSQSVKFRYSTRNVSKIGRKVGKKDTVEYRVKLK